MKLVKRIALFTILIFAVFNFFFVTFTLWQTKRFLNSPTTCLPSQSRLFALTSTTTSITLSPLRLLPIPKIKTFTYLFPQFFNLLSTSCQLTYNLNLFIQNPTLSNLQTLQSLYPNFTSSLYYFYQTYAYLNYPFLDRFTFFNSPDQLSNLVDLALNLKPFINRADLLLGFNKTQNYYILTQNNLELRPSGGFLGSYIKIKINKAKIQSITFHDVYEKDGNLPGHVNPPNPIQTAFQTGFWRLRDANWDVDFNQAAQDIAWFLTQSKEEAPFAIIAMNLSTIQSFLNLLPPIKLPDDDIVITADNLYQILHPSIKTNFYPGSKIKSRLLTHFGLASLNTIRSSSIVTKLKIADLIYQDLNHRNIFIHVFNPALQSHISQLRWDGGLHYQPSSNPNLLSDYFYFTESNLGANKMNCCVNRSANHQITILPNQINHQVTLTYNHIGNKDHPYLKLGRYLAYIRFVVPDAAFNIKLKFNQATIKPQLTLLTNNLLQIGFFITIKPYTNPTLQINYALPIKSPPRNYQLIIQRQPGLTYFHNLIVKNKNRILLSKYFPVNKDYKFYLKINQ